MHARRFLDEVVALAAATLATAAAASLVQTAINVRDIAHMGVAVSGAMHARVAWEDLVRFGPIMAAIAAAALVPSLPVARRLARGRPVWLQALALAVAGAAGLWIVFRLLALVTPMPALVVATGTPGGLWAVSATGLIGGLVYAWRASRPAPSSRRGAMAAAGLLALPIAAFVAAAPGYKGKAERADPASYAVQTVASGLTYPWSVATLPDGRMLVTEMGGRLLAIDAAGARTEIGLAGVPAVFHRGGEIGLMQVALDPDFAQNRWLYLTMGYGEEGANGTRLVRARLEGDRLHDVRVLFSGTPKATPGSNGGRLAFLRDGSLVLTLGDGTAPRMQAQNPRSHLGKLVRLDREGRVPADNPFVATPGAAPEVYTLGHKNVQGIALDRASGALWIAEHGARGGDELNRVRAGANYGWPLVTGGIDYSFARVSPFAQHAGFDDPVWQWTPSIAPSALAIYDGALFPGWQGSLLVSGLKERALRRVLREGERIVGEELLLAELGERLRDVHVAPDGAVLVLTDGPQARLLRLVPAASGS